MLSQVFSCAIWIRSLGKGLTPWVEHAISPGPSADVTLPAGEWVEVALQGISTLGRGPRGRGTEAHACGVPDAPRAVRARVIEVSRVGLPEEGEAAAEVIQVTWGEPRGVGGCPVTGYILTVDGEEVSIAPDVREAHVAESARACSSCSR